ncbi:MAG: sterol desaturase family protein [Leptospiraceae bacterium]|nr:sterol desaturase family protein [Leptospiraceae bacterium]MCP5511428.1 sterol desaturase family protein [Leptospiraceae bacterium]
MTDSIELNSLTLVKVYLINYSLLFVRYLIFAGLAYTFFWVWKKKKFQPYRIQKKFPSRASILTEFKYSASTFLIFSLVGVGIFIGKQMGWTRIYNDVSEYGWGYLVFSLIATILIHDTYFYWAHRMMHHRLLFKKVHLVHHLSTNPSPWASFSFHPYEAVLEAGILPLIVLILPIHPIAILLFILYMTMMNVLGHLGYEFYPKHFVKSPVWNWNNTSVHHNMHHKKFNCNYGLYFNWWDKICNTNHPEYADEFERVVSGRLIETSEESGVTLKTAA